MFQGLPRGLPNARNTTTMQRRAQFAGANVAVFNFLHMQSPCPCPLVTGQAVDRAILT